MSNCIYWQLPVWKHQSSKVEKQKYLNAWIKRSGVVISLGRKVLEMKNECKIMEDLKKESYDKGMKKAAFDVAARYYIKGVISLEEAAADASMRREDFAARAARTSSYANTSGRPTPCVQIFQ